MAAARRSAGSEISSRRIRRMSSARRTIVPPRRSSWSFLTSAKQPILACLFASSCSSYVKSVHMAGSCNCCMQRHCRYFARLAQDTSGGRVNTGMLAALRGKVRICSSPTFRPSGVFACLQISLHDTQMTGQLRFEDLQSLCNQERSARVGSTPAWCGAFD